MNPRDAALTPRGLLQKHLPWLRAYVQRRTGALIARRESLSDLVQSVCRELLQDEDDLAFRETAAFRRCLAQLAERKLGERSRYYRRKKRDVMREVLLEDMSEPGAEDSPERHAAEQDELRRLVLALDRLPPDYAEAFVRFHLLGMSHREIGAHLGRSEAATRTLLSRAVARLALHLSEPQPSGAGR